MNLSILFHKTNSLIFSKKKKRTAKIKIDNVSDFRKLKYGIMQTKKKEFGEGHISSAILFRILTHQHRNT